MLLGILQFDVLIHDAQSLKDKRRVVLAIKDRLHREHRAAIAEVAHQDNPALARMALAIIGTDGKVVAQSLDRITAKLRGMWHGSIDAELGDTRRQLLSAQQLPEDEDQPSPTDSIDTQLHAELLTRADEAMRDLEPPKSPERATP